ncbi:uncharacterized protein PHALS_11979 [Plasmopara halstedii]|uniref:Uncharacterized protein n=1 Tax=Plasmopara halstedii TaxID=4781 RepID=A0A0P1AK73_PLAHL|nr:uncharacterized protein PHALS_11979 [Plasmopara halstedii]CEG41647.1 hypothetical protein PHALS_11979 [Plasmopara halstedii]|eukprot:XP_024578016.1 hypothetical protein PHALS_11979 [Plasmopara halstedii]
MNDIPLERVKSVDSFQAFDRCVDAHCYIRAASIFSSLAAAHGPRAKKAPTAQSIILFSSHIPTARQHQSLSQYQEDYDLKKQEKIK